MDKEEKVNVKDLYSYKTFEWKSKYGDYNVLKVKNIDNKIEISIEQHEHGKKRGKYISFILPSDVFEEFVKAITTKYKPEELKNG